MAEKDITEKILEDYNDVFADIVNGLLFNGRQVIRENALTSGVDHSMYKADGKVHEQERDTAKFWKTGRGSVSVRLALIGIENQTEYDAEMPLRVIGYDGAAYRAELNDDSKVRYPVLTLVLHFGKERWKNRRLSDIISLTGEFQPYLNDYRINVFEIAYLSEEQLSYFHSDFRIVADYFVHSRDNPDYRPANPQKFSHVDEMLKLMSVLTNDKRYENISLSEIEKENATMDKVLDYWYNSGVAQGVAQGIAEGEARQAEKVEAEKRRADAAEQELRRLKERLAKYEPV